MTNKSPAGGMTDTVSTPIPCPWCGEVPRVEDHGDWWIAICPDTVPCPVVPVTKLCASRNLAVGLWNTRSPDTLKEAVVKAAMKVCWTLDPDHKHHRALLEALENLKQARALATTDKGPDSGVSIDPAES